MLKKFYMIYGITLSVLLGTGFAARWHAPDLGLMNGDGSSSGHSSGIFGGRSGSGFSGFHSGK